MSRTSLGRLLVSAAFAAGMVSRAAASSAPAPPAADEEGSMGRMLEIQKKLNEPITYELLVQMTLDKALDELLTRQGIPWTVNEAAFVAAQQDKNVVPKTDVDKIDKMVDVTRGTVLKKLLDTIPSDGGKGRPTYIIRRHYLEITTVGARQLETGETLPGSDGDSAIPVIPPLAYAAFDDASLGDALKELAHTTDSAIILDGREGNKVRVTAELPGVPVETAVRVLADMADLKVVRLGNVYYVTSPKKARLLQKEEDKRRLGGEMPKADAPNPSGAP